MRSAILALFLSSVATFYAEDKKEAKPLTPAEAAKKVNEKCTVEMEVQSAGGRNNYFLNSKKDFRDDGNFTIFISKAAADKFKQAKVANPVEHFKGKTIRVTGTVSLYQEKPQIKVDTPEQIKVVERK